MMRLALAFVLVTAPVACSGKNKQAPTSTGSGAGSGSATDVLAKKLFVHWGITQGATSGDVFLQTTDETGRQVSHPVGTYPGTCSATTPAPDMKALIAVTCKDGATGIELHGVIQGNHIVVLKLRVDDGVTPDPMAREEVTRVAFPIGAAIEAD